MGMGWGRTAVPCPSPRFGPSLNSDIPTPRSISISQPSPHLSPSPSHTHPCTSAFYMALLKFNGKSVGRAALRNMQERRTQVTS